VTITFGDLVADADWIPMNLTGQQQNPSYFWNDGGLLADAPVDFDATFGQNMFTTFGDGPTVSGTKQIDFPAFNRNPLRVVPGFTVPKHHHNIDEMLLCFAGEYFIETYDTPEPKTVRVGPGDVFLSRAGTPYTMTAGPEGVTYIETWPVSVRELETYWYDFGWVRR
jgi:mannose-6-phosphate isomerase-like protein (cupin superfamily)